MLFNEPKLLKLIPVNVVTDRSDSFSALQRAEIAEIYRPGKPTDKFGSFSALQRAEIAEIFQEAHLQVRGAGVSVLFNEPKLLKCESRTSVVSVL